MNSAPRSMHTSEPVSPSIDQKINRYRMPIVVRFKYGEELAGMQVHADGLSFESSAPMPVGRVVELILCGGAILVDAEIAECEPIVAGQGGFRVRARYHGLSEELRQLISEEIQRHRMEG